MNRALFILFLIAITAHSGGSIKCYVCNSVYEVGCKHDPKLYGIEPVECNTDTYRNSLKRFIKDTPADFNFHANIPQSAFTCIKLDVEANGEKLIDRNCVPSKNNPVDACKLYKAMFSAVDASTECNICEGDACNGATISSPNMFHTFLLIITSFVLTVYRPGL